MSKGPEIQMVDLVSQYREIAPEVQQAIEEVMNSSAFINGPAVKQFAADLEKYTGSEKVIPCGNGTDALQIALMALGLEPGDEVIVPAFTYVATVEVIALLHLKPVFIDVDPDTFNIDVSQLEKVKTNKTRAIIVVHLFGQCCEMEPVMEFSEKYDIPVIEDNAQALGAKYSFSDGTEKFGGTIGKIGTTSFFPSKNLGAYGDGGALFTQDEELGEKIRMVANHGQKRKYYHDIVGVNSRLDSLHAAILSVKLKYLDKYAAARQKAAAYYNNALSGIDDLTIPVRSEFSTHVYHQYTTKIESGKRDEFREYLSENGIPSMIYYPVPQHLQKAYRSYGYKKGQFPVSEKLCEEVCSIPVHTELTEEQVNYISEVIKSFYK